MKNYLTIHNIAKFHLPLTLAMRLNMLRCSKNGDFDLGEVSGKVPIEWVMEHQAYSCYVPSLTSKIKSIGNSLSVPTLGT